MTTLLATARAQKHRGRRGMQQSSGVSRDLSPATRSRAAVRWLPVLDVAGAEKAGGAPKAGALGASATLVAQDCAQCEQRVNYWGAGDETLVALNLLVCRIKFGQRQDRAAALFLEKIAPKIGDLSSHVFRQLNGKRPKAEIEHYLSGQAIYHLLKTYQVEAIAYPLQFLFGQFGVVFFDAHAIVKRWISTDKHESLGSDAEGTAPVTDHADPDLLRAAGHYDVDAHAETAPDAALAHREHTEAVQSAWRTVLAGAKLTAREERVVRFFLWAQTEYDAVAAKRLRSEFATRELGVTLEQFDALAGKALQKLRSSVDPSHIRAVLRG